VECMTNPQAADFAGFVKLWGMEHVRICRVDDFDKFETGPKTTLLEVVPNARDTEKFWQLWDKMG